MNLPSTINTIILVLPNSRYFSVCLRHLRPCRPSLDHFLAVNGRTQDSPAASSLTFIQPNTDDTDDRLTHTFAIMSTFSTRSEPDGSWQFLRPAGSDAKVPIVSSLDQLPIPATRSEKKRVNFATNRGFYGARSIL